MLKTRREGYLLIDNRHAPGPDGTRFLEAATFTCSHCQAQVIYNPMRTRDRGWCRKCDSYVCDSCEAVRAVHGCKPYLEVLDDLDRQLNRQRIL
jgi:hypothetical protein